MSFLLQFFTFDTLKVVAPLFWGCVYGTGKYCQMNQQCVLAFFCIVHNSTH